MLNALLKDEKIEDYDYVILCDDDIWLPPGFLDAFLGLQQKYDFALAQPARTHNSYIDFTIVEKIDGLVARRTSGLLMLRLNEHWSFSSGVFFGNNQSQLTPEIYAKLKGNYLLHEIAVLGFVIFMEKIPGPA